MDPETLKQLYYQMLRIRLIEETIAELYPEQEMRCPVHLCTGQEAVSAGVCLNLTPKDYVLSTHRSHGHYLAKGGDLKTMMAEIYGKVTGCCQGKGGSMHLVDLDCGFLGAVPIVGSTIPMGVGAALGTAMQGEQRVTVVFFGEGATEEGVFYESLNFAVLKNLPVVLVCENNLFSVYSPLVVRQPENRNTGEIARAHGMESYRGNGNEVEEVYQLARRAIIKAREGGGPTYLEFSTYRWREHCGPNFDNHLGYRAECDFLEWRDRCPLKTFQDRLLAEGILGQQDLEAMESKIKKEFEEAVHFAKTSPFPPENQLIEDVYAP